MLLPGLRRFEPEASTDQAPDHRARDGASGREKLDDRRTRQRRPEPSARPAPEPARRNSGGGLRTVVQRVARASVSVDGEVIGRVQEGLLALVGVAKGDGPTDIEY